MNDEPSPLEHADADALQQRLRALPRERMPPPAAWSTIAARLEPRAAPVRHARRPRHWRNGGVGVALAAAVAVLAVLLVPRLQAPAPAGAPPLVVQAAAMADEYQRAIAAMPHGQLSTDLQPALRELDASAQAIQAALRQSPDTGFLLSQLQRTYAKRLQLTRMAVLDAASRPT